eukprot:8579449-Alexandrium_andersonii.AAC.1
MTLATSLSGCTMPLNAAGRTVANMQLDRNLMRNLGLGKEGSLTEVHHNQPPELPDPSRALRARQRRALNLSD